MQMAHKMYLSSSCSHVSAADREQTTLTMLLQPDLAQHQEVPKEYKLDVTATTVANTYIFTEQDLPGFKSKSRKGFDPKTANLPARLTRPRFDKAGDKAPWDPKKRFQPYFRRAIPKKTALAGRVAHEVNCVPVDNPETNRILTERTLAAMKPKSSTVFLAGNKGQEAGFIQPGTLRAQQAFGGFIKGTAIVKSKSGQETKTARMPQNELLDLIFQCFREYNFWSMKALRARLRQPEAYLRETLEKVADMPRSGRFAMHWTLKKENKVDINDELAADAAPEVEGLEDEEMADGEDDEDEDIKFEDVQQA
jgi:transcription initiation factor TFIIF subunit beta